MTGDAVGPDLKLGPTSFRKDHVADEPDEELASLVYVLDLQEAIPGVQRLRDWVLERLAPRPGETAVDVGCGTGTEVRRMAGMVGTSGRAVGIEPHAGLRAEAISRAEGAASVELLDGDAQSLPFADGTVDVLRCERVWQHLPDPDAAAREVARVLAAGGRAAIVDSDWGSVVLSPAEPDVLRRYEQASWEQMANPFAGRHLRTQLRAAGLSVDPDIGADAVVFPDDVMRNAGPIRPNIEPAVAGGALTADEAERLVAGIEEAAGRGEAFMAVTMFAVVARRA